MTWTGKTFSVGAILTAADMNNLQADITALANGDVGAPAIVQTALGASAVGQSQLKTTTSDQSIGPSTGLKKIVPTGGDYSFHSFVSMASAYYPVNSDNVAYSTSIVTNTNTASITMYLHSRYVQASPPYDLGDGEIPLFVYIMVEKVTGKVRGVSVAPEASWHHNGKTDIRATRKCSVTNRSWKKVKTIDAELLDLKLTKEEAVANKIFTFDQVADRLITDNDVEIEITQAIKQADMNDVPHPYLGNDLSDIDIVMLDPVKTEKLLALHDDGVNIVKLIEDGVITFGNTALNRTMPNGIIAVDFTL